MNMLETKPAVFVVKEHYHIMIPVTCPCLMWVKVGDMCYYDESCGIMKSDVRVHRTIVPKAALDKERKYVVCARKIIERKPYFTQTEETSELPFDFKPVEGENIRAYHISDCHDMVEHPVRAVRAYGEIDFLILNGDIQNHSGNTENIMNIYKITDALTGGNIPIVFSRGNHDMRGICAEKLEEFTPYSNGNTFYTFRLGYLWGMVLDCGEDKSDESNAYGNTVCCHNFRLRQSEFIREVIRNAKEEYLHESVKHKIVICHNPFTRKMLPPFDIEGEIYRDWAKLIRKDVKPDIMICGHTHKLEIDEVGGKNDFYGQACPVLKNQTVGKMTDVTLWDNPEGTVNQLNNAIGTKFYTLKSNDLKWFVPLDVAKGSALYQPHLATYAGVTVTENEIVNSAYYTDGADSTLIERIGIRKTTSKINPPKNVVRTFDEETNSVTLTWDAPDAQNDQAVKRYVVYDENNAYEKNWTVFTTDTSITIPMGNTQYSDTDFVVKSIGIHSVSDAGSN